MELCFSLIAQQGSDPDWIVPLITAAAGLLGVCLGTSLQLLGERGKRNHEVNEARRTERLEAYCGYINYLRTAWHPMENVIGQDLEKGMEALNAMMIESFEYRTLITLLASERVKTFLDEHGESGDEAFIDAMKQIIPRIQMRIDSGELQDTTAVNRATRAEIKKAWAEIVRPYVRHLLECMRDDFH